MECFGYDGRPEQIAGGPKLYLAVLLISVNAWSQGSGEVLTYPEKLRQAHGGVKSTCWGMNVLE